MKKSLCLALAMLTCAGAYAQNEISAASCSFKMALAQTEKPDGRRGISMNVKASNKQVFAITSEQETALNENYTVRIIDPNTNTEFQFSDDPKWQPGAKSVSITEINDISGAISKITFKAKWGKGKFTVSCKASASGAMMTPIKAGREPGHPDATHQVGTEFTGPVNFEAKTYMSFDSNQTQTGMIKADGTYTESMQNSMKSKSLVDAPLPE